MKSTTNKEISKASLRYQDENELENTVTEPSKNKSNEMDNSFDGAPKYKYLSEFFNKLQKTYKSGSKQIKENETSINIGVKSRSLLHSNTEIKKSTSKLKNLNPNLLKNAKKDLKKSKDKSLNLTSGNLNISLINNLNITEIHNPNILNIDRKLSQIEEDKKSFLEDVGLCDTDLLNSESDGLNTPKEIDCFSSNENSVNSNFDISHLSNISLLEEKKKLKEAATNKKSIIANKPNSSKYVNKNLKEIQSKEKIKINRDFDTNVNDILSGNKNNLRKSMNCLPSKFNGRDANKAKTSKNLVASVKKLEQVKQNLNSKQEKINKHSSRESYNPLSTINSYAREKTPTTASTRKEDKVKQKSDLNENKKQRNTVANNLNISQNYKLINTISEIDTIDLENIQTNKSNKIGPMVKKNSTLAGALGVKVDPKNKNNSQGVNERDKDKNTSMHNMSLVNNLLHSNAYDEINMPKRKISFSISHIHHYDDLLNELEEIFGENLENFDEEILLNTLEDFDTKVLIRSLILLAFEQKKIIKKLQSGNKLLERGYDHIAVKNEARELFKEPSTAAYYNHVINQVKLKDRSEFFTKPIDRETAFLTKPTDRELTFSTKPIDRKSTETRTALGKETAIKNYFSKLPDIEQDFDIGRSKKEPIKSQPKVTQVRSSSVIIKKPPKQNKALNSSHLEGLIAIKKNIKTPSKKLI